MVRIVKNPKCAAETNVLLGMLGASPAQDFLRSLDERTKGNISSVYLSRSRLGKVQSGVGTWASKELGLLFLGTQLCPMKGCGYLLMATVLEVFCVLFANIV